MKEMIIKLARDGLNYRSILESKFRELQIDIRKASDNPRRFDMDLQNQSAHYLYVLNEGKRGRYGRDFNFEDYFLDYDATTGEKTCIKLHVYFTLILDLQTKVHDFLGKKSPDSSFNVHAVNKLIDLMVYIHNIFIEIYRENSRLLTNFDGEIAVLEDSASKIKHNRGIKSLQNQIHSYLSIHFDLFHSLLDHLVMNFEARIRLIVPEDHLPSETEILSFPKPNWDRHYNPEGLLDIDLLQIMSFKICPRVNKMETVDLIRAWLYMKSFLNESSVAPLVDHQMGVRAHLSQYILLLNVVKYAVQRNFM